MAENNPYLDLFNGLVPLQKKTGSETSKKKKDSYFHIVVSEGEPFLVMDKRAGSEAGMDAEEMKLCNEIQRISFSGDVFKINLFQNQDLKVSLWENPYLLMMLKSFSCINGPSGKPITIEDKNAEIILEVTAEEQNPEATLKLKVRRDDKETEDFVFLDDSQVLLGDSICNIKSIGVNYTKIQKFITPIEKGLLESYLTLLLSYIDNIKVEFNGKPARYINTPEKSIPTLFLEKVATDKALYMRTGVSLDSLDKTLPSGFIPTCSVRIDENQNVLIRVVEPCSIKEKTDELETMILKCAPDRNAKKEVYREDNFFIIPEATAGPFLLNHLPQILEEFRIVGSSKLREYKVVAVTPKLNLKVSSGIDFLEGEGDIEIGDEKFTISDLLNQYTRQKYIKLSDGNRGIIDENYIQRLQRLFKRQDKKGRIYVNIFNLPEVEEMIQKKLTGEFANKSRAVLEGFNGLQKASVPEYKVEATLRPYQNEGVKWLNYLYENNLGGCLADDMGLGKTLQTIALLSLIYPKCKKASLIIMPRSLLFNWEKELKRFAPKIKFYTYYEGDRDIKKAMKSHLILTTYGLIRNDIEKFKDQKFQCIILDESQNIKNYSAQTTLAVQLLESDHRFALSGTPMENNLTELYSLFRFLNPTMFGTIEEFNSSYTTPIQKYGDKDASSSLRRKIFPFILRRLKKDVLKDLPPRIDLTRYVEMSEKQAKVYNERRISYRRQIKEAIAKEGVQKSQFMMFQALNELRRIASVPESVTNNSVASPKISELMDLLEESVNNGHKSVVFFNYLAGLEIVMERLEKLGIQYETMTGSTTATERKRIVERFQTDQECKILLLTLKVGGVGLNLTAADMVYIFEPWWNKAAEEQAINRLHRIGQKSTVNSFSLITVGTIEEKILQLQEQKSEWFNELITADGSSSKHLSEKDIDFILS